MASKISEQEMIQKERKKKEAKKVVILEVSIEL